MKLVIDLDDKVYGLLKYFESGLGLNDKKDVNDDVKTALMRAVLNGTILPKGHGALKDTDKIISDGISKGFCDWYDEIKYADTIIEADTERNDKE